MVTYIVTCMVCAARPVYEASFREVLSEPERLAKRSVGVCKACGPAYLEAKRNNTPQTHSAGPFYKIKVGG